MAWTSIIQEIDRKKQGLKSIDDINKEVEERAKKLRYYTEGELDDQ